MTGPPVEQRTSAGVLVRLCVMMLLQFGAFGAWFATLGLVLATHQLPMIIGAAYGLGSLASLFSPMVLGALADRFFASEKVLAASHIVCAGLMFLLPRFVDAADPTATLWLIFLYMLAFQPTLALTNNIAFRHLGTDSQRYPYIRVFGTLGWIIAGLAVGTLAWSASTMIFTFSSIVSVALAAYALTLPHTPPAGRGARFKLGDLIGREAFVLFRQRNFIVFSIVALLIGCCLGAYNAYGSPFLGALGMGQVASVLVIGPLSEIIFIVSIPFVLKRFGLKWALLTGMLAWAIRFVFFMIATGGQSGWMFAGIALHGVCNDFFLVLGAMYLDQITQANLKAQGQSLFQVIFMGLGGFLGANIVGVVFNNSMAVDQSLAAWIPVWGVPAALAGAAALIWVLFFNPRRHQADIAAA